MMMTISRGAMEALIALEFDGADELKQFIAQARIELSPSEQDSLAAYRRILAASGTERESGMNCSHAVDKCRFGLRCCTRAALILCALLASATAQASGKDSLYVYRDSGNMRYQCVADLVYIDTSGNSVAALDSCTMTSRDLRLWPVFPPHPIHLEYTGLQFNVMPTQDCQLVLHMLNQDRTTSTIVDCRSGQ